MIFSITIEDRPTTNQIPSISLKTSFSVAKEETTKGWRGPSGTLEGVYIDGAAPTLKDLTSVFVGLGVHSVSATILADSVFYFIQGGAQTVYGNFTRYYEEVSINGKFAYWRTTYTLYLYEDGDNSPSPGHSYTAVYEGPQLWSMPENFEA